MAVVAHLIVWMLAGGAAVVAAAFSALVVLSWMFGESPQDQSFYGGMAIDEPEPDDIIFREPRRAYSLNDLNV